MDTIGCAGEVALVVTEEDFSKCEMQIRVKFRDTVPMQVLSSNVQSGGERSVSTMLYLISLQDLTSCPFRLVDEINQGMDPRNERMIFSQVVAAATRPGLPQYFLITPKLLPGLTYNKATTILCVFNGPHHIPQSEYNLTKFVSAAIAHRNAKRPRNENDADINH